MTTVRLWAGVSVALSMGLSSAGCRRSVQRGNLPEGLPGRYVDELVAIADKAALQCDELIVQRDCYDHIGSQTGGPSGDPAKVVPLPTHPLGGTGTLKLLFARCLKTLEAPVHYCSSGPVAEPPELTEVCGEMKDLPGWRGLVEGRDGEQISISSSQKCPQPWILVDVVRQSPNRNKLALAAFLRP